MKHQYTKLCFVAIVAVLLLNIGCTGDKHTIKKTFHLTTEANFNVVDTSSNTNYDQVQVLDVSSQVSDFSKYKGDAISVNLDSITYYTTYVIDPTADSSQQIVNAAIKMGTVGGSDEISFGEVQNVNLKGIFESSKSRTLVLNSGAIAKFSTLLMNSPYKGQVRFQGSVNTGPTNFTVRVKFHFTFVAWIA